nr:DNA mismatch repair endonuclease MutL [Lachnospiraceae bacterium]
MAEIHILDSATVDQIAAGEVVERPVSVVKELVENAIDAGATHVTVQIREGGISMIRVSDDGSGIEKSEIKKAFMRHATSKIEVAEDLNAIHTLGFRGEALSSICAVSKVELITKTATDLTGARLVIEGGSAKEPEEIGAPTGTTLVIRDLFYNTPARKKFLKTPATEGSYISEYMQHLALAAPKVAFQFVMNDQTKFYTSGNGEIKDIVYRIWGREVTSHLLPYEASMDGAVIRGYLGRPILARANRSFETLFINGRYIKSALLSSAIEEGYRTLLMQHKYPFVVLYFSIDPSRLDVNVHPTKLDVRISEPGELLKLLTETIARTLTGGSLIQPSLQQAGLKPNKEEAAVRRGEEKQLTRQIPQPFETSRVAEKSSYGMERTARESVAGESAAGEGAVKITAMPREQDNQAPAGLSNSEASKEQVEEIDLFDEKKGVVLEAFTPKTLSRNTQTEHRILGETAQKPVGTQPSAIIKQKDMVIVEKPRQMELFEEEEIRGQQIENFTILGQVFDTYWLLTM